MDKVDLPYNPNAAFIQKNQFADYQFYIFAVRTYLSFILICVLIEISSQTILFSQ